MISIFVSSDSDSSFLAGNSFQFCELYIWSWSTAVQSCIFFQFACGVLFTSPSVEDTSRRSRPRAASEATLRKNMAVLQRSSAAGLGQWFWCGTLNTSKAAFWSGNPRFVSSCRSSAGRTANIPVCYILGIYLVYVTHRLECGIFPWYLSHEDSRCTNCLYGLLLQQLLAICCCHWSSHGSCPSDSCCLPNENRKQ